MNILAFGIHPDDVELGCGGTVVLAARQGHGVVVVDLSDGAAASNGTPEIRAKEAARAAEIMGIGRRVNLGLPDGAIQSENTDYLKAVVRAIREARPDLVLAPSGDDPHPDHAAGATLVERALYLAGVHGYEAQQEAWSVRNVLVYPGRNELEPNVVVDISSCWDTKVEAIRAHESQFVAGPGRKPTPLNAPDFLAVMEARSRVFGQKIRVPHGEPFRSPRPIALQDLAVFGA
ncbi:MAG: bacillithiol biosynthesis deacetylase BshB1 [Candidatus Krumholzibacteria bacterium]